MGCSTGPSPPPKRARASRIRRSSLRRWSWPASGPARRSTSATPPTRTSPARRRPGSARCSSIATGATGTSPPSRSSVSISGREGHESAGFWRRALAITLDNAVWLVGIPMILGWLPIHYDHLSDLQAYIGVLVFASLWFNYFSFCEWRWGQTIGKNAVGLEVRSLDGAERLTFGQASIRNLLRLI